MTRWEYLEVWWESRHVTINTFSIRGQTQDKVGSRDWPGVFAKLGADGWELTGVIASPTGAQQYWYYFKRPLSS